MQDNVHLWRKIWILKQFHGIFKLKVNTHIMNTF